MEGQFGLEKIKVYKMLLEVFNDAFVGIVIFEDAFGKKPLLKLGTQTLYSMPQQLQLVP